MKTFACCLCLDTCSNARVYVHTYGFILGFFLHGVYDHAWNLPTYPVKVVFMSEPADNETPVETVRESDCTALAQ